MPGVQRDCGEITYGSNFPCSQYHDPRGGRQSALEMNILRYRAYEINLFLFYVEDLKIFMLDNVYPMINSSKNIASLKTAEETRLAKIVTELTFEACSKDKISAKDAEGIRQLVNHRTDDSKRLKRAFVYAVENGMCTQESSEEIQKLIKYRNEIAHRTYKITADISRHFIAIDYASFLKTGYQADALDRIRPLRRSLLDSRQIATYLVNMNSLIFESTERFYEAELKRLDSRIRNQAKAANDLSNKIRADIEHVKIQFSNEMDPRHPRNFCAPVYLGGEDYKYSNKLTTRGVEVCYRLFDSGLENLTICYLIGLTLRSIERRRKGWLNEGGLNRTRSTLDG